MEDNKNNDDNNIISNFGDGQTLNLEKLEDKIVLVFDYEIDNMQIGDSDNKLVYIDEKTNQSKEISPEYFFDKLKPLPKLISSNDPDEAKFNTSEFDDEFEEYDETENSEKLYKANFIKRLVSKKKRRFQDSDFDLDMSYITEKVIAMGFPSTGFETMYRNSLSDIVKFFRIRHNDDVKVYNLCLEKDRIYNKNFFPKSKVGLFPATDHNPCPIKLILEFCIDICLYLIKNPNGVAAVHCKAGKGRTGVMICSYLIFSGLCNSSEKAFRYYARVRTKNNTGITIASQRRYIKYFETFLQSNFYQPYVNCIPKIIRNHFSFLIDKNDKIKIKNILQSFQKERSYFISSNTFKLKGIKLGPFTKGKELKIKICNFVDTKFDLPKKTLTESKTEDSKGNVYYEQYYNPELIVHSDIKIKIKKDLNFFLWVNLWYSTWEIIKSLYDKKTGNTKPINFNSIKSCSNINNLSLNNNEDSNKPGEEKNNNKFKINIINDNEKKIQDDEFFVNAGKRRHSNSLYEIIRKLKHNTDLNELINNMNSNLKLGFDKENMEIKLHSYEFDKFQEIKNFGDLEMTIFYTISEK